MPTTGALMDAGVEGVRMVGDRRRDVCGWRGLGEGFMVN